MYIYLVIQILCTTFASTKKQTFVYTKVITKKLINK